MHEKNDTEKKARFCFNEVLMFLNIVLNGAVKCTLVFALREPTTLLSGLYV